MHVLIVTACLAADPQTCAPRLLPAGMAADPAACASGAGKTVADWIAAHPGVTAQGWTCAPLADAPALTLDEIAPGVLVHRGDDAPLSPENRGSIANLVVVIGTRQVAVIDPGGSREEGERLFAAIRARTELPIGPVILTHMHPDHIAGAEVFAEAGAEVTGHARLPDALAARRPTWIDSMPGQLGAAPWIGTALIAPARLVDRETTVGLGGTDLTLTPTGPAHTDTDLLVRDSRTDTLFTGDLVFRGLTPVVDGSLNGWLGWLATPPKAARVVPGHGPVAASMAEATAEETAYLNALRDAVRAALAAGLGLSDAVPAVAAALAGQAAGWADFAPTTARNAATAFAELEWE